MSLQILQIESRVGIPFLSAALITSGLVLWHFSARNKVTKKIISRKEFSQKVPKVELHVHLDGAYHHERLFYWAKQYLDQLPSEISVPWNQKKIYLQESIRSCETIEDFSRLVSCPIGATSLEDYLEPFCFFLPIPRGRLDVLADLAYHFCKSQAEQNVIYTEVRYSPHEVVDEEAKTISAHDVVLCITETIERAKKEFNIEIKQILCCICSHPEWADEVVTLAQEFRNRGVVAVDIAAGEMHFDDNDYRIGHEKAMNKAFEKSINISVHAGESGPPSNVWNAIEVYHAQRIGHGYHLLDDIKLYEKVRKMKNIHFEMCPTSSIATKAWISDNHYDHPLKRFLQDGFSVSISTDDPSITPTNINDEYLFVMNSIGLNSSELYRCVINAVQSSFSEEKVKQSLTKEVNTFFETYDFV